MRIRTSNRSVILSDRRESKDLRTNFTANIPEVRRSFDFGLRPSLRMTKLQNTLNIPQYSLKKLLQSVLQQLFDQFTRYRTLGLPPVS